MSDDWTRLCALLDDDPDLLTSVGAAAGDPDEADPWGAVIDGLDDAGALAYLERGDAGVELADALAGVPRVFRAGVDLEPVADVEGELPAAIARADAILAPQGLRLVYLAEDSDAFPLVVVPVAHADEIVALATKLGHEARVFG
ncbi:DUF6630 family protein [Microbacterium invictum]|uniref:DUF6630 domain-containing protein n=1 Tax=Microbacterium invictum TaxID=515415 RepID=A0AA40VP31_9MICO|nr:MULTISPECIES: hypothetical protein [Microbacterium]MBB4141033.1 hypothetical protein [Microbacterium invictum]